MNLFFWPSSFIDKFLECHASGCGYIAFHAHPRFSPMTSRFSLQFSSYFFSFMEIVRVQMLCKCISALDIQKIAGVYLLSLVSMTSEYEWILAHFLSDSGIFMVSSLLPFTGTVHNCTDRSLPHEYRTTQTTDCCRSLPCRFVICLTVRP